VLDQRVTAAVAIATFILGLFAVTRASAPYGFARLIGRNRLGATSMHVRDPVLIVGHEYMNSKCSKKLRQMPSACLAVWRAP
jgi:hypothetical protein